MTIKYKFNVIVNKRTTSTDRFGNKNKLLLTGCPSAQPEGAGVHRASTKLVANFEHPYYTTGVSLVAQMVKNLRVMQETQVSSLGQEDPLEKGMATHSSILAWRIPWKTSLVAYSLWGCKELNTTKQLTLSLSLSYHGRSEQMNNFIVQGLMKCRFRGSVLH